MHSPLPKRQRPRAPGATAAPLHLSAWLRAWRPLAVAVLWPPVVAALGAHPEGAAALAAGWPGVLMALLALQGVILFGNDLADHRGDLENPTPPPWSGGSRVLVERLLTRRQLAIGLVVALSAFAAAVPMTPTAIPTAPWWALGCALATALYDLPWIRLSHRPTGALLQGLGLGVLLPGLTLALLGHDPLTLPWGLAIPGVLLGTAQGIASALPDEAADLRVRKRTWPVVFGPERARGDAGVLVGLAAITILATATNGAPGHHGANSWIWAILAAAAGLLLATRRPPQRDSLLLSCGILLCWTAYSLALASPS